MSVPAGSAAVRGCSAPLFSNSARQMVVLSELIAKHLIGENLDNFADSFHAEPFAPTTTERGLSSFEHAHIVAALDVINSYQRDRKARSSLHILGHRSSIGRTFKADPRTRFLEVYKRWLRQNACSNVISEGELRAFCELTRDVMNHGKLFPSRNHRSFMRTMAEVYDHLLWQLKEVLERDRTCAELVQRILSLTKNLISDSVAFLMLACTVLQQTDALPTLEIVALWQSLPTESTPLPSRVEPALQKSMKDAWQTRCGSVIASVVCTPWAVRLFDGASAQAEASEVAGYRRAAQLAVADAQQQRGGDTVKTRNPSTVDLIQEVRREFQQGIFKHSGLAGTLRRQDMEQPRESYLQALQTVFDVTYLNGEALVQFHRISNGLGDYGMIRAAPWLHPFLGALADKVQKLKALQSHVKDVMDKALVLARHKNQKVDSPAPSSRMCARAHAAIARAINGPSSHVEQLTSALEDLRSRSAPERMPELRGELSDACQQLRGVLSSPEFLARVGDGFQVPNALPADCSASPSPMLALADSGSVTTCGGEQKQKQQGEQLQLKWRTGDAADLSPSVTPAGSAGSSPGLVTDAIVLAEAAPGATGLATQPPAVRSSSTPALQHQESKRSGARNRSRPPLPKSLPAVPTFGRHPGHGAAALEEASLEALQQRPTASMRKAASLENTQAVNPFDDDVALVPIMSGVPLAKLAAPDSEAPVVPAVPLDDAPVCQRTPTADANPFDDDVVVVQANPFEDDVVDLPSTWSAERRPSEGSDACSSTTAGSSSRGVRSVDLVALAKRAPFKDVALAQKSVVKSDASRSSSTPATSSRLPTSLVAASSALRSYSPAFGMSTRKLQSSVGVGSGDSAKGDMRMDVYRLTASYFGQGMRRHDRRSLRIWKGFLHIFDKNSTKVVKSTIDVKEDMISCAILSPGVLSMCFQRAQEADDEAPGTPTPTASGATAGPKMYFFEFDSRKQAQAFEAELKRIKEAV